MHVTHPCALVMEPSHEYRETFVTCACRRGWGYRLSWAGSQRYRNGAPTMDHALALHARHMRGPGRHFLERLKQPVVLYEA